MSSSRKRNGPSFSAVFLVLLVAGSLGLFSCSKAKKAESRGEMNSQEVSSEGGSVQESQEAVRQPAEQAPEINASSVELAVKRLGNTFAALEDAIQRIPRETFDPEAVIQAAGSDPVKLFDWVRDKTRLVPYQGSLRGSVGVLMDRRGNSLDRALLLCELLRRAGYETRLARRHLSEEEAGAILKRIESGTAKETSALQQRSLRDKDDLTALYVQNFELDRNHLTETITKSEREQENKTRQVESERKELTADISSLLSKLENESRRGQNAGKDDLKDHWWVQWDKSGEWTDLDPTLPGSQPGQTFGEPEETLDPDALEERLFHSIKFSIIAEQFEQGNLKEKPVLQYTLVPSKTMGKRIVLRHLPLNWPSEKAFFSASKPEPFLKESIAEQAEWQAALEIDGEAVEKSYLTAQGKISPKPSQKGGSKKGGAGGVGGLFGGLTGAVEEGEEEKEKEEAEIPNGRSQLSAEWLELEISSPGRPAQVHRREIFDLIGPEARKGKNLAAWKLTEQDRVNRAFKILDEIEVLPQVCELSPEFIEERTANFVLLNRDAYLSLFENYEGWEPQGMFQEMTKIKQLSARLYSLALKRFRLSPVRSEIALCSPNLLAHHSALRTNEQGEVVKSESLDIIANAVTPTAAASASPFSVQVEQGILDTLVEANVLADGETVENAALLYRQSRTQGVNWLLIRGLDDPDWKRIQVSADTRARLEKDLSRGFAIIIPAKEISVAGKPRFAWWRLNPETGNLLGLGQNGAGQAMTEYAEKVDIVLQVKGIVEYYANLGRCLGIGITAPLRGNRPQHDELVIQCIWSTICTNASSVAGAFMDIDVNWTNIIINETINWAMGSLCDTLWEKGIKK